MAQKLSEKTRWDKNRAMVSRWKLRKGCCKCSFKAEYGFQLELDHIMPKTKRKGTYRAFEVSWSKEKIKRELSLCQVLCKNCHALKTYEENHEKV
jgi:5-methylcytosine-specific restriction endonuclease McrA|tara:strand:+ start:57 stop:341 length:285 start_codon:yes stop_codon:yes gene_type:complete